MLIVLGNSLRRQKLRRGVYSDAGVLERRYGFLKNGRAYGRNISRITACNFRILKTGLSAMGGGGFLTHFRCKCLQKIALCKSLSYQAAFKFLFLINEEFRGAISAYYSKLKSANGGSRRAYSCS